MVVLAEATGNYTALARSLTNASKYPRNDCGVHAPEHTLNALQSYLDRRASDLFSLKSKVHFLEVYRHGEAPEYTVLCDPAILERHLRQPFEKQQRPDLPQRFIFIHAQDSKSPLRVTRHMLLQVLTYLQVAPKFLDFVCSFGKQLHDEFQISGFRSETCRQRRRPRLKVPQLERSGRHIELCYNLKSAEHTKHVSQPWAIRQCAVHHKFDLESQQSSWIIIKANKVIRESIHQMLQTEARTSASNDSGQSRSPLAKTLRIHEAICSWAGDNWHRCITDLEAELQDGSRATLYDPQEVTEPCHQLSYAAPSDPGVDPPRKESMRAVKSFGRALKRTTASLTLRDDQVTLRDFDKPKDDFESEKPCITIAIEDYKFGSLQEIQRFEDRFHSILLALKANSRVIGDLRREYTDLENSSDPIVTDSRVDLEEFQRHLESVSKDLEMQESRLEILIKIAADRKALVQGILQYRNMLATQQFAIRAQETAEDMRDMTQEMHRIADKTVVETVSMKIITVVTLLFLPGTFISTLMSTPIVHFEQPTSGFSGKNLGIGALKLYLAVTIPLTIVTFVAVLSWLWWYLRGRQGRIALDPVSKIA